MAEVKREMNDFERSTIKWARVAVLMSGLAAIFVCLQWYEMHTGSADTHDLAEAAKKQADAAKSLAERTKDLADRMKDQADQTKVIADQAIVQADASKRLAQNAVDTLGNTQKTFQTEQRAWIGVQDAASVDFVETTPWRVNVTFFNSGRTPARNVQSAMMYTTSNVPISGRPWSKSNSSRSAPCNPWRPKADSA